MELNTIGNIFDDLFELLEPKAESTAARFALCRRKLVKFFAWRHCDDPDSLADETIVRLLKNVDQGTELSADHPYSYVYGIAINVYQESRRQKAKNRVLTDLTEIEQSAVLPETDGCGALCLKALSPEKRELLAHYYLDDDDRKDIAGEHAGTLNALRLKIHRIKQELKRCREDCQKRSETKKLI